MPARSTYLHLAAKAGIVFAALFLVSVLLAAMPGRRTPAVHDMTRGHMDAHNLHLHMTAMRPQTPDDLARANEIVAQLRSGIEKYKDYHAAVNGGYKIFLPNL